MSGIEWKFIVTFYSFSECFSTFGAFFGKKVIFPLMSTDKIETGGVTKVKQNFFAFLEISEKLNHYQLLALKMKKRASII